VAGFIGVYVLVRHRSFLQRIMHFPSPFPSVEAAGVAFTNVSAVCVVACQGVLGASVGLLELTSSVLAYVLPARKKEGHRAWMLVAKKTQHNSGAMGA
jgi:hypothetical protein